MNWTSDRLRIRLSFIKHCFNLVRMRDWMRTEELNRKTIPEYARNHEAVQLERRWIRKGKEDNFAGIRLPVPKIEFSLRWIWMQMQDTVVGLWGTVLIWCHWIVPSTNMSVEAWEMKSLLQDRFLTRIPRFRATLRASVCSPHKSPPNLTDCQTDLHVQDRYFCFSSGSFQVRSYN